ncbi:HET-domain-containing protein, partial [Trametes versicolor FP-101664 SS1]|uniref:HET-domain-containing protein n=1 Tax=Trametes versicolor (strain FP-101664) TaxID=717944 RepID=UPI000462428E
YLALSYVWGKDSEQTPYRTTTSNLSTYEHRIDPRVLPLTIRDAIYVTHKLGFRWLWVDSLCIIQDSDSDKTHEIGRMHHVYRYAHVTIMAGSAEGVGSGFLQKRSPPDDVALPFICPPYPPNSTEHQPGVKAYEDELGCMATRAWCMQEYLLSPRALIFTPRTILFRCLTAKAGTVGVSNLHYSIWGEPRIPISLFLPPTAPAPEPDSKEWREMCRAWAYVIEDYTRRTASDPLDKLVACAAVAEQFHRALGSEYLAGFWRSDALLVHLLWEAKHGDWDTRGTGKVCGHRHARPAAYRAPSWSWAAIDGPTSHFGANQCALLLGDPRTVALAKVAECWVALEHPELRFGRVTDGALVLR